MLLAIGILVPGLLVTGLNPPGRAAAQGSKPATESSGRLVNAGFQACKAREAAIDALMARIIKRGELQFTAIETYSTRTQDFYRRGGKQMANYTDILAAHDARKAVAQKSLADLKQTAEGFACDGEAPKTLLQTFENQSHAMVDDLEAFKQAVLGLIVGNKQLQGAAAAGGGR